VNLYLDNIVFHLQKAGGISKFWSKLISNLDNKDMVIHFLDCDNQKNPNIFRDEIAHLISDRVQYSPEVLISLQRYLSVGSNKYEDKSVFHSSYLRNPKCKLVPTVHTIHDFMYEKYDTGLRKALHIYQKKAAMRRADHIVCVSEQTKSDMFSLYPWTKDKKVSVIYNGVDTEFFKDNNAKEKLLKLDLEFDDFLLYVGSRGYCKNFPMVLEMFASEYSRDNKLTLVCVGGGAFSKLETDLLSKFKINDSVILLNSVESKLLNILYNTAIALVMPSMYEGFGIPALEATAAGCLVLGANNSSIPEVVGRSDYLFNPNDINEALLKLELLDDADLATSVRDYSLKHSANFTWEKNSDEYVGIYNNFFC
jgi:glycosyltransferase involved in cell wall biosynthesis